MYLSGIQALVRLPLDQHRADIRRGLKTATFISGYRGSPLGGLDQTLERMTTLLRAHDVVFSSGLNEDLGATAVYGSQMAGLFPNPRYDGVLGMWYGKAPGVDRTGDVFKHANYAGVGKNGGVLALAGDDPLSKSSTLAEPLRGRALRRADAHDLPGQRAGDPRSRPARLHALAHVRALGGRQDRHERGGRGGHRRGGSGSREPDHPGGRAGRQALPAPDQREPDPALRPRHGAHASRRAPRAGPALRVREQAQPHHGAVAERVVRHRHERQDLLRRPPGPRRARARRRRAAPLRHPHPQDRHAVPDGAAHRARVRARPAGDPRRRGEALVRRDVLQGRALRPGGPAAGGGQARRGGPAAAVAGRRARLRPASRGPSPGASPVASRSTRWRRASSTSTSSSAGPRR